MKRIKFLCLLVSSAITVLYAQDSAELANQYDSLLTSLKKNSAEDSNRAKTLALLGDICPKADSAVLFLQQSIALCQKINFLPGEGDARDFFGNYYWNVSNYTGALKQYMATLKIGEQLHDKSLIDRAYGNMGNTYLSLGNPRKALDYILESLSIEHGMKLKDSNALALSGLAIAYLQLNIFDSALYYGNRAVYYSFKDGPEPFTASALGSMGDIYAKKNDVVQALQYYRRGIIQAEKTGFALQSGTIMTSVAKLFYRSGEKDSAVYYAKQALKVATAYKIPAVIVESGNLLHTIYKSSDEQQSMRYLEMAESAKDSLFNNQKLNDLQDIAYNEEALQKEREEAVVQYKNNLKLYGLIGLAIVIGIIAIIQLRSNNQKRAANIRLEKQKEKIEITLAELKATQSQLIQSEKMASLGELTAGIAHEIQNPLNFVNNFSEVNKEMLVEMKDDLDKGNVDDAKAIADDIIGNEEKINYHGKRADAIVKGMLQHSRSSTGQKEPTDINALADEYLRLSYHGLRAKDSTYNAKMTTDFDPGIGEINIVAQDIGRVLLNLYTNAFYTVGEKKQSAGPEYEPTVSVSSKKTGDRVEIRVKDNGNGIPKMVVDKIFQPFFTTKPTGQGTGLGLSLSYDIIKAHGGEIKVATKEGERTEFVVELPLK